MSVVLMRELKTFYFVIFLFWDIFILVKQNFGGFCMRTLLGGTDAMMYSQWKILPKISCTRCFQGPNCEPKKKWCCCVFFSACLGGIAVWKFEQTWNCALSSVCFLTCNWKRCHLFPIPFCAFSIFSQVKRLDKSFFSLLIGSYYSLTLLKQLIN